MCPPRRPGDWGTSRGFKGISAPRLRTPEADSGVTACAPTVVGHPWGAYPERRARRTERGAGGDSPCPWASPQGVRPTCPPVRRPRRRRQRVMEEARPWCHVQSGHLPGLLCPPRLDPGHTGEPDFYSLCVLGWSLVLDSWLPQCHLFFTLQSPQPPAQHRPRAGPLPWPLDGQVRAPHTHRRRHRPCGRSGVAPCP